jgi:tryptophan-rich hypothetical protein
MPKKQKFPYLVGSKWTAAQETFGWRHFVVTNRQNQSNLVFAELKATCDESVRFWVNAKALRDRDLWTPGWLTLDEMRKDETLAIIGN